MYGMKKLLTSYHTKKVKVDVISSAPAGYICIAPLSTEHMITIKTTVLNNLREKFMQQGFTENEPLLLVMAYGLKSDRWPIDNYMFLDDQRNQWYCGNERVPYSILCHKKEGDIIELAINGKLVCVQCKQLGSYYEQFAPGKRFEDILAEYRNKIEKDCLAKGSPEASLPTIKTNVYLSNLTDALLAAGIFLVPLIKLGLTRD